MTTDRLASIICRVSLALAVAALTVAGLSSTAWAQARTWHYNSNNFTQPASLPRYTGAPIHPKFACHQTAAPAVPVVAAPATACNTCAPTTVASCNTCAPVVAAKPSCCGLGGLFGKHSLWPSTTYYQPVTAYYQPANPCNTCGQTTVLRPVTVTAWRPWWSGYSRYYASYQPFSYTGCGLFGCGSSCSTCSSPVYGGSTVSYAAPACNSCASASTTVPYYQPAQPGIAVPAQPGLSVPAQPGVAVPGQPGAAVPGQPGAAGPGQQTEPTPSLEPTPDAGSSGQPPSTFREEGRPDYDLRNDIDDSQPSLSPIPNGNSLNGHGTSHSYDPTIEPSDRTTRLPSSSLIRPAAITRTDAETLERQDAAGWRAAPR